MFGGNELTCTDLAVARGLIDLGDKDAVSDLPVNLLNALFLNADLLEEELREAGEIPTEPIDEILRETFWVDREGREEPLGLAPCRCNDPAVSPDDTRVAFIVGVQDETDSDIWIWSLAQRRFMRLTSGPGEKRAPVWKGR